MHVSLRFALALFAALLLFAPRHAAAAEGRPQVYLMRGLANVFSYGLDDLAAKLNARGIPATVYEFGEWQTVAEQASAARRANRDTPIILIGHSLGADGAIRAAEQLTALGTPPKLVITFDPVGVDTVGAAAGRFVNYYQNNGYGRPLTAGPGFRGKLVNYNLDKSTDIDHFNIEKSPMLHKEVVAKVRALMPRPKPKPVPTQAPATGTDSDSSARAAVPIGQKAM